MAADQEGKTKRKKHRRRRILKWVLPVTFVLVLLGVLALPVLVSSSACGRMILTKINDRVAGETDFGSLSMSWWSGVKVTDFSFQDAVGGISVQVKQISTKPHYGSLLAGNLSFGETTITEPRLRVDLSRPVAQADSPRQEAPSRRPSGAPALPIKKIDLRITEGNLVVKGPQSETVEVSQINSQVNLRPVGKQTSFDAKMNVVSQGEQAQISVDGQIQPSKKKGWTFKGTSGQLTVEIDDLDLTSLGPILALAGVDIEAKGRVSANIKSSIKDGRIKDLSGSVGGKDLDISGEQLQGDRLRTKALDIAVKLKGKDELINIERLQVDSDWGTARASGVAPTTFGSLEGFLTSGAKNKLEGSFDFDLKEIFSQMPNTLGIKEGTEITSGRLTGTVEAFGGKLSGQAQLAELAGRVGGETVALSEPVEAVVEIGTENEKMTFDKAEVTTSFAKIKLAGTSELLEYEEQVDLGKLSSEVGQFLDMGGYKIAGEVFGKGKVSIAKDRISTEGSGTVKGLSLSSADGNSVSEPQADVSFSVTIERERGVLDVKFVDAKASLGQISIKDAVLPLSEKQGKPLKLGISASEVDLEKLQPFLVMFASFPKKTQMGGLAESRLAVSSKDSTYTIKTDSSRIRNLKLETPGQEPFARDEVLFVFDGDYTPVEGNWTIRKMQLISEPNISIEFTGESKVEGETTKVNGQARLDYDWAAVSSIARPYLPSGLEVKGERKDSIDFSIEYPAGQKKELLANLNTKAKLGFEQAKYMGMNIGEAEMTIEVRNGILKIAPFSTTVNGGKLNFAGNIDLKESPMVLRTSGPMQMIDKVKIDDEISRKLLMYLNPIFARASKVSGLANFDCEKLSIPLAGENKNEIEVIGTISIERLRLEASDLLGQIFSFAGTGVPGQDFTIRPTRFTLANGVLRYDDMQVDVGDNPINFTDAIVGLDESYDMMVALPWTLSGKTIGADRNVESERIRVRLKTTAGETPKLDLGSLLQEQLKQRLKDELRKGLEDLFK